MRDRERYRKKEREKERVNKANSVNDTVKILSLVKRGGNKNR